MKKITCVHCQKNWYIDEKDSYKTSVCPFCKFELPDSVRIIESLGQAVFVCIRENETKILEQTEEFFDTVKELFPEGKKTVNIFSRNLLPKEIGIIRESFEEENGEEKIKKLSLALVENNGLDKLWAEEFENEFFTAIKDYKNIVLSVENRHKPVLPQKNASAQYSLGNQYYYGNGVPQSYEEAAKCYRKAAEQGNAYAQYRLGHQYYYGYGVPQSYEEAVKWYRKAAEQGNAYAQYRLEHQYYEEAVIVKWYRKAAEQGNAYCQKNLGDMYYYGNGVPQSYNEATKWYKKAAEQGNTEAQNALKRIQMQ